MRGKHIPERLLRHLWLHRYFTPPLSTADGKSLTVIFPGRPNDGGGPDFLDARVAIGGTIYRGDVELHRRAADWLLHGHPDDPKYNRLILHVVLEEARESRDTIVACGRIIPTLHLKQFLPDRLKHLHSNLLRHETRAARIPCSHLNDSFDPLALTGWVDTMARKRWEIKVRNMEERLVQLRGGEAREPRLQFGVIDQEGLPEEIPPPLPPGQVHSSQEAWEQLLYEGIMDGLGYSRNRLPFLTLARNVPLSLFRSLSVIESHEQTLAVLYGVAGFIDEPGITGLAPRWKQLNDQLSVARLSKVDWQLSPNRPANHPLLRIRAAAEFVRRIIDEHLFEKIVEAAVLPDAARGRRERLIALMNVRAHHARRGHALVGSSRAAEIVANTILPLLSLFARHSMRKDVRQAARELYDSFPPLSDNSILRKMRSQLMRKKLPLDSMRRQQGALHLFHHYCAEERCGACDVGKVVFKDYIEHDDAGAS